MSETTRLQARAAELVPQARAGNAAAREELLACSHGTVRRWVGVLIPDADDADDVTQEVLIRVARSLDRFAGRSRYTTWLYQITRHTALGLRRRAARRLRLASDLSSRETGGAVSDPHREAEVSELRTLMTAWFRELPRRQREVFALIDLEGYDAGEVALMLGFRPVTVRAHLFRARRALRRRILERHPEIAEEFTQ